MIEKMKQIKQVLNPEGGGAATTEAGPPIGEVVTEIREEHEDATILTETSNDGSVQLQTTLGEAIRELIENAVELNDNTMAEIELVELENEWIEVRVRDDGPGMLEMEAGILETGEETPLDYGGGLGLWMVRMIVTQAGSDVSVATTDGIEINLRVPAMRCS